MPPRRSLPARRRPCPGWPRTAPPRTSAPAIESIGVPCRGASYPPPRPRGEPWKMQTPSCGPKHHDTSPPHPRPCHQLGGRRRHGDAAGGAHPPRVSRGPSGRARPSLGGGALPAAARRRNHHRHRRGGLEGSAQPLAGTKTSGFHGSCAPAIASMRPSRLFIHSLLSGRGKSPPGLFPGPKTSGFHGSCAPAIASMRPSRLFIHSLLSRVAPARGPA